MQRQFSTGDLAVRGFAEADLETCVAIFNAAWRVARPDIAWHIDAREFRSLVEDEEIVVAATADDGVVGFIALYRPEAFVHHLYIDPAWHGRGIGRLLLATLKAQSTARLNLKCMRQNHGALAFYRALGWVKDGEGEGEHGPWVRLCAPLAG